MYVERVEGTVKGNVSANLGRLTLIVGPNGSGKSRLINTLELALLGFASDVVGRAEMRKEGELIALAEGDELIAKVVLNDGRVSQWGTQKTKTGAKRADHVKSVQAEFPVTEVRGALTGSVETARKWLLQRIAATVSRNDVKKYLVSDESETLFETKAKYLQGSEVDILVGVLESAKSEKRSKSTQATANAKSIATLADGLAPEPTEAQLNGAKDLAEAAMQNYRQAVEQSAIQRTMAPPAPLEPAYAELVGLGELLAKVRQYNDQLVEQLQAQGGELTPDDAVLYDIRAKLLDITKLHQQHGAHQCLVCNGTIFGNAMQQRADTLTRGMEKMASRKTFADELAEGRTIEKEVQSRFDASLANYNALKEAHAVYVVPSATSNGDAVAEAQRVWESANQAVVALTKAAEGWRSVRSLKQEEREAKRAVGHLEELIEGCKAAVEGILKSATTDFIAKVQSYLPTTDVFALELEDGEREVCRFGFVRNGQLHTALSGAEWARLTIALACATSTDSPDTLRIFVPEDRAFDPHTLRGVLEALTSAPGQVIIATTTKPAGRLPKGWTMVETGGTE